MSLTEFPDLSAFQAGLSIEGAPFAVFRATEGNWLRDAACAGFVAEAKRRGISHALYHFIESGSSAESQARFCHGVAGDTPLMLDFEPIVASSAGVLAVDDPGGMGQFCGSSWPAVQAWLGSQHAAGTALEPAGAPFISKPGLGEALGFVDRYRALGGICHAVYLPRWYHQILGSPSLKPFADRGVFLVSSDYTAYSDNGPGWAEYGGMTPAVWQHSDSHPLNGRAVDWNACKHDVAGLRGLFASGSATGVLNPVSGLSATARYTQVDAKWDRAPHATRYLVKARVGDSAEVARETTTETGSVTLHGLREGTRYRISVWAEPGSGDAASVFVTTKRA